jgi:hypothetical protein
MRMRLEKTPICRPFCSTINGFRQARGFDSERFRSAQGPGAASGAS